MSTPTQEDRENADAMVTKIVNLVICRHQLAKKFIMVNDLYNLLYSIKDNERDRQKQGDLAIPSVLPKLRGDESKTRLQHLVKNELVPVESSV